MGFFAFFIFTVERKVIRKIIYQFETRRQFFIKRVKGRKKSIEMIVSVYNETLNFELLFSHYFLQRKTI